MSKQETEEFILRYETIDVKNWNPEIHTRPVSVSFNEYFAGFKKAFERLQSLDRRAFNETMAVKLDLPQIIKSAALFDKEARMLLMVRHILPNQGSGLSDGLYFELDTKHLSQENFEKVTGLQLGAVTRKGPLLDYYIVPETSTLKPIPLNQNDRELLRRISRGPRSIKGDNDKGLNL